MKNDPRLGSDPLSSLVPGPVHGEVLLGALHTPRAPEAVPVLPAGLLDALDEPVVLHLPDGTTLFANRSFRELAGLAPGTPLPSLACLLSPSDAATENEDEAAGWVPATLGASEAGRGVLRRTSAATGPDRVGRLLLTTVRATTRGQAASGLAGFLDSALPGFDELENARLFDRLSASRERFMIAAMSSGERFDARSWTAPSLAAAADECLAALRELHGLPANALRVRSAAPELRAGRAEGILALFVAFVLLDLALEDTSRVPAPGSLCLDILEARGGLLMSITDNAGLLPDSLSLSDRKNGVLRAVAGMSATRGGILTLAHGGILTLAHGGRPRVLCLRLPAGTPQPSRNGGSHE